MDKNCLPRLLLVEDDAISRSFIQTALQGLPAQVDAAASAADALAQPGPHTLWLIDATLPDNDGIGLLSQLRQGAADVVALAHAADSSAEKRRALLDAGFVDVLVKPLSALELQARVRAQLPLCTINDWNEASALKALNGNAEHVAMLRKLFLDELPATMANVERAVASSDPATVTAHLHKLRASCGFVGAQRLALAVSNLQQSPLSGQSLHELQRAAHALLD